jgi:hypothetical protein
MGSLLVALALMGLLTPLAITWARSEATDLRILVSVLLLAPPAFFMGMMFPLGVGIWRSQSQLLPFFWSVNGITSALASVLGMALSIEFGIAATYGIGAGFYAVCAVLLLMRASSQQRGVHAISEIADAEDSPRPAYEV